MYLSDSQIREKLGEISFETDSRHPFDPDSQIQPCSVDLRLSPVFWRPNRTVLPVDLARSRLLEVQPRRNWTRVLLKEGESIILKPGQMVLCRVYEQFTVPADCAGHIEGRSSFARMGLSVQSSASFINPGWRGHMPLALVNHSPMRISIPAYLPICQLLLVPLSSRPERIYGAPSLRNKYMDDDGGPSYWWRDKIVESLLHSFGQPDMQRSMQEKLLERVGVPSDEILARMERLISTRPAGHYGNADEFVEEFAQLEDKKKMRDLIVRAAAKGAPAVLLSATLGSFFVHPIGILHIVIWAITAASLIPAIAAFRGGSGEYLGTKEIRAIDAKKINASAH